MHVRREDMHICVSSLLKCKMHLHDSVRGHLHYATVEFKVQIYICIAVLQIALQLQQRLQYPSIFNRIQPWVTVLGPLPFL
jgi:hypothetical protein